MADIDPYPHLLASVDCHRAASAVEQLASPLDWRQEPPGSNGDPLCPVQAYHTSSPPFMNSARGSTPALTPSFGILLTQL